MKKIVATILGLFAGGMAIGQTLESYIEEAEANNPAVQAFEIRYHITQEKIMEANTLPNTELSAGLFISEPETRTGAQKMRFSIKQMLPWFGTITARENYASSLSDTEYLEITIAKRKLRLSVSQAYYKLYAIKANLLVLEENIQLLKSYEQLALASVEVGKASAVDVLRLQIRQNEMQELLKVLELKFDSEIGVFNSLLNRAQDSQASIADKLTIPSGQEEVNKALGLHPELEKYDRLFQSVTQFEKLNQKKSNPNLGFGLDYIPVEERTDMTIVNSGKDILMPMVSLSIPIFNNSYKSISAQNKLRKDEIMAKKTDRKNLLESLLISAINNREAAKISYNTQIKNLEEANNAEDILIKNYETGTINFNDVLDIQELKLQFQKKKIEATKDYYNQRAVINYLSNQ